MTTTRQLIARGFAAAGTGAIALAFIGAAATAVVTMTAIGTMLATAPTERIVLVAARRDAAPSKAPVLVAVAQGARSDLGASSGR